MLFQRNCKKIDDGGGGTKLAADNNNNDKIESKRSDRGSVFKGAKQFVIRESILTELFRTSDIAVIYNLFFAILVLLILNTVVKESLEQGHLSFNLWIIHYNFGRLWVSLLVWIGMFASICYIVDPLFRRWANTPSVRVTATTELHWIMMYIAFIFGMFYVPLRVLFYMELPIASSFVVTCEVTRLLMKVHAYIRENVPRGVLRKIGNSDGDKTNAGWPTRQQLVYFILCPSFVYRDNYPRNERCNWLLVIKYFAQCLGSILYTGYIFTRFCMPIFEQLDYRTVSYQTMILSVFPSILPGSFCMLLLFWGLLHCWLNMFAEIMRFGDRQFYLDWWNSRSMAEYYKKWNIVVHEWLYYYVYRDVTQLLGGRRCGTLIAQITVFFMSAAVHEFWFGIAFRIFYPIMFAVYFICGGTFFFVSRLIKMDQAWNMLMWFNLMIGDGMFIALYSMEWYARQRCEPSFDNQFLDTIVPRSWVCK